MLTSCVCRSSAMSGLLVKCVDDGLDARGAGFGRVFVFAEAHALADVDEHGDLRIVNDLARRAALDAEEEHEQAGEREAAAAA